MHNHYDNLIGKEMFATIGEPWNFTSKSGDGLLIGVVKSIVFTEKVEPVIRCEVSEFEFNGVVFREIFAVNRYRKSQDFLQTFMDGKRTGGNLFYFDGSIGLDDDATIKEVFKSNDNFLIGSIALGKWKGWEALEREVAHFIAEVNSEVPPGPAR